MDFDWKVVVAALTPLLFALVFGDPRGGRPPGPVLFFAGYFAVAAILSAAAALTRRGSWPRSALLVVSGVMQILGGLYFVVVGWGVLLLVSGGLATAVGSLNERNR